MRSRCLRDLPAAGPAAVSRPCVPPSVSLGPLAMYACAKFVSAPALVRRSSRVLCQPLSAPVLSSPEARREQAQAGAPPAHPDQRDPPGHRHRRQVHRRRRCHRGGGRLWRWHRHRLREPHHRLRQEPFAEAAAFLVCHLGLCPLRGHGAVLPHGGLPHPLRHVMEPVTVTVTVTEPLPLRPVPCPAENPG
ncbi:hypothetical protein Q9966_016306 [Columba livia]|nr:hypothetical protein Q9966_016306 [Columba livia]